MNQALEAYFRLMNEAGLIRLGRVFAGNGEPISDEYTWAALDKTGDWFAYTVEPVATSGIYLRGSGKMARYLAAMKEEEVYDPIVIGF